MSVDVALARERNGFLGGLAAITGIAAITTITGLAKLRASVIGSSYTQLCD
ncbi:MAG: hypothetical protein P8Y67_13730 [Alphaproteobacteria bacterium]